MISFPFCRLKSVWIESLTLYSQLQIEQSQVYKSEELKECQHRTISHLYTASITIGGRDWSQRLMKLMEGSASPLAVKSDVLYEDNFKNVFVVLEPFNMSRT